MPTRRTLFFAAVVCPCIAAAIYLLDPQQEPKTIWGFWRVAAGAAACYLLITAAIAWFRGRPGR